MGTKKIALVESRLDLGAGIQGAGAGINALKATAKTRGFSFFDRYPSVSVPEIDTSKSLGDQTPFGKHINLIYEANAQAASLVEQSLAQGHFTVMLTGDHSNAIGSVSGVKNHFHNKRLGVIWIDAHGDLHSPYTTPSGNVHGMPMGALLGLNNLKPERNAISEHSKVFWEQLKTLGSHQITPKVQPEDVVFIDIRDLEAEEWAVIHDKNIRYFEPSDVQEQGIIAVAQQTLAHLQHCEVIHISFDVDSMDPSVSQGTGTPVANGLSLEQAKTLLQTLLQDDRVVSLELTEVNPSLDTDNAMPEAVVDILAELFPDH